MLSYNSHLVSLRRWRHAINHLMCAWISLASRPNRDKTKANFFGYFHAHLLPSWQLILDLIFLFSTRCFSFPPSDHHRNVSDSRKRKKREKSVNEKNSAAIECARRKKIFSVVMNLPWTSTSLTIFTSFTNESKSIENLIGSNGDDPSLEIHLRSLDSILLVCSLCGQSRFSLFFSSFVFFLSFRGSPRLLLIALSCGCEIIFVFFFPFFFLAAVVIRAK